jgi:cysteine-rich repeat protein
MTRYSGRVLFAAAFLVATRGFASLTPPECLPQGAPALLSTDSSLHLYARMEEASGTRVDSSAFHNDLSPFGSPAPSSSSDHEEGSASLDLVASGSQYLQRDSASLDSGFPGNTGGGNTYLTIAAWVKPTTDGHNHPLIVKVDSGRSYTVWLWNFGNGGLQVDPNIFDAAGNDYNARGVADFHGNTIIQSGQWYHFTYTYDGTTGSSRVYVNGALDAGPFNENMTTYFAGGGNLQIGYRAGFGGDSYADVLLDEVVILDRVLSDAEVASLYQNGVVTQSVYSACDDGNVCTADSCNANDVCVYTPLTGTSCDDGNACTQTDTCQSGTCTGTNPVVCAALDQCHVAGTCDTQTGTCSNPAQTNGTSCNDGDACTQTDTCQSGTCTGTNPVVCAALDQCHVAGICNPSTGFCSNPNKPDTTPCDDGNACTIADQCLGGVCTGNSNHCGDGVVQASCGEQCDDGNSNNHDGCKNDCTLNTCGDGVVYDGVEQCDDGNQDARDGCGPTCQLEPRGLICQRIIGILGRTLAFYQMALRDACLDRVAVGVLGCEGNQCALFPGTASSLPVNGSSCVVGADCCPSFDYTIPAATTEGRLASVEVLVERAIRAICSTAIGPDHRIGTDDDTYMSPQTLGYDAMCPDTFGQCGTIPTTTMASSGSDNDLIDCVECTARASASALLGASYPLQASDAKGRLCQRLLGLEAARLNEVRVIWQQVCLDRTVSNMLGCQAGQCVFYPGTANPLPVSGSTCTVAADCCPNFDALVPNKTTAAVLAYYEKGLTAVMKVVCSEAPGPDYRFGTDDDTYVDASTLGFGGMCLQTFGQCGTVPMTPLAAPGPNNDLVDCLACSADNAADGLVNFYMHRRP